ncbi:acVLRF1 family peptidyl-tRNA hydrolase [Pseudokineococcus basanitobsidens]|uniref:AcVLRF1 family peptidyl-tRNA hydrolase n=1 Tax=Pseudokineococcus basanitobsidens TaxID=1926649 RepID=A0ABU8RLV8_9ACTN
MPLDRAAGWLGRFTAAHGEVSLVAAGSGEVRLTAEDGALATWSCGGRDLLAGAGPGSPLQAEEVLDRLTAPRTALVLLLRRGGAVAAVLASGRTGGGPGVAAPARVLDARVRTARVQSRTAAGGWSQQRFARRRAGQAAGLARDAAATASRVWRAHVDAADLLATGGDRGLLEDCLRQLEPGLGRVAGLPRQDVALPADPRRRVLDAVAGDVGALRVEVTDP